ncbi:MAG: ATP-binding protein [Chloroflexota bacterium]|nr:ATP-binding protein [Chloroflexota bacterium]
MSGHPPDNLEKIFEPFFTTNEVGKGIGLGLSICYGIVQKNVGDIHIRGKEGEGRLSQLNYLSLPRKLNVRCRGHPYMSPYFQDEGSAKWTKAAGKDRS